MDSAVFLEVPVAVVDIVVVAVVLTAIATHH